MVDNPCDTCIVDVMCSKPCGKFIGFMKEFSFNHSYFIAKIYNVVKTNSRFDRAISFAIFYNKTKLCDRITHYHETYLKHKEIKDDLSM